MKYEPGLAGALLARTPLMLRALLEGLPDVWLDASDGSGAWTPREVACHLADLEQTAWLPRVRTILEHGEAQPLPPVERERFRRRYAGASIDAALTDFEQGRAANLRALDALDLDEQVLASMGRHRELGQVRLSELLSAWVVHDQTHLSQISRALAAQYREGVGPWREFLSVLRPR